MKFKLAAIALIASVTLSCNTSFGCELLDRMLGRAGCSSCEAPQAPSCGCGGGLMDKIVGKSAGCGCCGDDMLTYDANMSCGPVASPCGCEAAPVAAPCGCDAAPVEAPCGCDAAPAPKCGGLNLFSKFGNRGCGCGTPEPVIAPVADCGCGAVEAAPVADCGCSAPVADCGCSAPAPVADCGCGVVEAAPVADCGCGAPVATPYVGEVAGKKSCFMGLFSKFKKPSISAPVADCGCGAVEVAPVSDCGCGAVEVAPVSDCGCGSPAPVADCGCGAVETAPVADCGCGSPVIESDCGCGSPATAAPARKWFSSVRPAAGGCGCGAPIVESTYGGSAVTPCGCDSAPRGKLTLLDRLRGNRIPRTREGVVIGSQCSDGCNSPCPQQPSDCGCGNPAPVYQAAPCTSCGGGEVIYTQAQPTSGCTSCGGSQGEVIYGTPETLPAETAAGSQEATYVAPPAAPATESNATEGMIEPGDGTSQASPVVDPGAFIPARRSTFGS